MAATNWAMQRAIKAQNDLAFELRYAYKTRFWLSGSVFLFIMSFVALCLTAWTSVSPIDGSTNVANFFETCIGLPIGIVCYIGYKLVYRIKFVKPLEADLKTGRKQLSEEGIAALDAHYPQSLAKRTTSYFLF